MAEGFFEPCSLAVLAEHMRDGRWLDIRTDECLVQRVRIVEMVVRVFGEELVVRQEWLDGEEEFCKQQFAIDSESIWKAQPTAYAIAEVEPYGVAVKRVFGGDVESDSDEVLRCLVTLASVRFDLPPEKLTGGPRAREGCLLERYTCMLVLYEMTDLNPYNVCYSFGYKSQTPWHGGVQWYLKRDAKTRDFMVTNGQQLVRLVDTAMRATSRRTRAAWERNHDGSPMVTA